MKLNKITGSFLVLFSILLIGVAGYHFIEGWSFFDSLYMSVITLATVGYGETHPLSTSGRLFTIFLILGGMGILLYGITEITAFLIEGEMHGFLRRRKMEKLIDKLSGHYIICGGGRSGSHILNELLKTKRDCVVVEKDPIRARLLAEKSVPVIEGDATEDSVLLSAGIERAKGLASALPTDKDNLFTVISARGLNSKLRIVSKTDEIGVRDKFLRSGADAVVATMFIGGMRMASEMVRPHATNFLDTMLRGNSDLRVEDIEIPAESKVIGKSIKQCDFQSKSGILLVTIKNSDQFSFNPNPETILKGGDKLVIIGHPDQIKQLKEILNP